MNTKVLYSVFKRNFVGYLSNPTGYVFICVFVLLSSIAAFLPDEFFNANLANLDQLNLWFPLIMLVFVPAITMGIWADERRQGTDELLLTIPASDFDIVLGKFKAAVCIYSVSLLFSFICNLLILKYLGMPDTGLFICTYIGYWFVGVSMISIGMVASFLTGNLTVAYILGTIFCSPLIALQWIDASPVPAETAQLLKSFGIASQFELFGRGIINFSSILYFAMITSTMLYLSMVMIGRRHWTAHQKWIGTFHFSLRSICLLILGLSLCFIFRQYDLRTDLTEEKLSTLSPETIKLLQHLKPEYPVVIEAFLSPDVPESHVQTRLDILSILDEIQSKCGKNVAVRIFNIKPNTEEALIANQRYEIKPQEVSFAARGKRELKSIFLGVAFRSGLNSLTLPFIDRGLSVEYELVHALYGVTTPQKKRIGILKTDAPLFGKFDMQTFSMSPQWQIIDELQRQYTVVEVDPVEPIRDKFDALLAVQPSALGPAEIDNFIDAVKRGQPTVIFEDPLPVYVRSVAGTAEPRQPPSQMMMMMGRQTPKGDISPLWTLLGVTIDGTQAIWQEYSPIRKLAQIPKGFVFLDRSLEVERKVLPFNIDDPVSASLQYVMLPFPGHITKSPTPESSTFTVTSLLYTFQQPAGTVQTRAVMQGLGNGTWERSCIAEDRPEELAVRIRGELPPPPALELKEGETPVKPEPTKINILLVADIDMLSDALFSLRRMGNEPGAGINLNFDNVTFVLNAIDSVAGDERFLAVRNRRPKHRTLSKFDENTDDIRKVTNDKRNALQKQFDAQTETEEKELTDKMKELEKGLKEKTVNEDEALRKLGVAMVTAQKRLNSAKEKQQRELNIQLEKADVELNENIRRIQGQYKLAAVTLPPIPPLLIALGVFFVRKIRETEGIPQSRRKK
ncbi:MAG: Gldg family protein [Planctomycetaceae bacterium]|jgi:ABC-2 type transport system permease protein|nr:Gldg family protein [Planctomycetaceae bacterium]